MTKFKRLLKDKQFILGLLFTLALIMFYTYIIIIGNIHNLCQTVAINTCNTVDSLFPELLSSNYIIYIIFIIILVTLSLFTWKYIKTKRKKYLFFILVLLVSIIISYIVDPILSKEIWKIILKS